ncbi:hypothetical protein [Streptomyces sp. NPDC087787]|uniref:hypothetical protein n=1 Tax=Streptomyces sp. NPDC087787 TaxID=3365803 RepID=UPI0037FE6359
MLSHFGWIGRLRTWWHDTPVAIRWVAYVAIPLGFVTAGLGAYGDSHHWWDGRSFVTNLASSFVSLLFGVPTALVVLAHLSEMQAEAMERRAVQRSARQAAAEFERALLAGIKAQDLAEAHHAVNHAAVASCEYRDRLGDVRRAGRGSLEAYGARQAAFDEHLNLGRLDYRIWLTDIALRWNRLDTEVRPRLDEMGLRWMAMPSYLVLRNGVQTLETLEGRAFTPRLEEDLEGLVRLPPRLRTVRTRELTAEAEATSACLSALADMIRHVNYVRSVAT